MLHQGISIYCFSEHNFIAKYLNNNGRGGGGWKKSYDGQEKRVSNKTSAVCTNFISLFSEIQRFFHAVMFGRHMETKMFNLLRKKQQIRTTC